MIGTERLPYGEITEPAPGVSHWERCTKDIRETVNGVPVWRRLAWYRCTELGCTYSTPPIVLAEFNNAVVMAHLQIGVMHRRQKHTEETT